MFEDIVSEKFSGIDIGDRKIIDELMQAIKTTADFAIAEMGLDIEALDLITEFFDRNSRKIAEMYLDEFEPNELMELLDFELTETAKKKLVFQLKVQKFMAEAMMDMLEEKDKEEKEKRDKHIKDMFEEMSEENEERDEWC